MKLLKISASGLPLFKDKCEIDFLALQRVTLENAEKMSCLFSANSKCFYQNNVMSFIGINASGKTSILKLISLVCGIINNQPINNNSCNEVLDGLNSEGKVSFDIFFYSENRTVNLLHTVIGKRGNKFIILDEFLKSKPISKVKNKNSVFDFEEHKALLTRNNNEIFLLDDVSIMVAVNRMMNDSFVVTDMLQYTNINQLSISEDCPSELISFFDSSVEYLHVKTERKNTDIRLKFCGREEISLNNLSHLNRYLSSGTIKGINTFLNATRIFKTGGYLIIDELENHFNREIVSTLIRFYMDKKVNPKGAMLIFSTHYAELLDEFERNDNIYIVRNRGGISAENLSAILDRNDIKKSEAYQSGFLEGTVPMYDSYMALKNSLMASHKETE
ncbi:MAG: ATP-binding protein [Clostridia bacterium]|nr:ATP-binding protein [Clostridia bacterium]